MSLSSKVTELRELSFRDATRLVFRKLIYRKVELGRFGMRAGDSDFVIPDDDLVITIEGADHFDEVAATNPHMSADDIDHFRRQNTAVIIVRDVDRIAASSWMTRGRVYVHELQRHVDVPEGEHFSCRSYVDPDYRGRALFSSMIHTYSMSVRPDDEVWGPVYLWNLASVRSLEKIGWRHSGDHWTRHVLGMKFAGSRQFPPRPPIVGAARRE